MRVSELSPLSRLWSRSVRSGSSPGPGARARKSRLRCLSDARIGDRVRLVEAPGKEVRMWLLLSDWEEPTEVQVLHSGWGGVVVSMGERRVAVPRWVAQAALVTCIRNSKSTFNTGDKP